VAAAQRVQVAQEAAASANLEATLAQAVAAARQEAVGALSRQVRQLEVELMRASNPNPNPNLCRARCGSWRWSSCGRLTLTLTLTSVAPGAAAGGGAHARVVGAGVVEPRAGEVLPLPVSVTGELKYRGARMVRTQCPLYKRTLIVKYKI
jgi:hypothetical protein